MGIFDSIGNIVRGQLIDVIEWTDSTNNTIVHKYDMNGKEIMMGAQLTVRESQVAIFVNEGKLADVFQPGRYELSTANMPVMTALKAWKFGFNSPFKSDVYFVNTKQFLDCKWGTTNPVMMRDAEFGMIRLRAFGAYSFRVADPEVFLREVFGTSSEYTVQDVEGQLKRTLVSGRYTQYQAAEAMREAANNPGGMAGAGVGMGAGVAMGQAFAQAMQATQQPAAPVQQQPTAQKGSFCANCGEQLTPGAKFCPNCGQKQETANVCPACGQKVQPGAKFCANCGQKL